MWEGDFLRRSIFSDALLLGTTELLLRTVSMLFRLFLTNRIGAAGLGLLQLCFTAASFAMTLALSGLRTAVMYLCAEEYGSRRPGGVRRALQLCLRLGLVLSIAAGGAMFFLSDRMAGTWIGNENAAEGLRILAIGLPFGVFGCILSGYLTVCKKIRALVGAEILEQLLSVLFTFLLLPRFDGTVGVCSAVLLGGLFASAASSACLLLLVFREIKTLGRAQRGLDMGSRLTRICIPLALSSYLRTGLSTAEHFLIPRGLEKSLSPEAALAAYGTIHGMVFPAMMFPSAILFALSDLLVAELARCKAAGMTLRVRHLTQKALRFGFLFSAAVAAMLFMLSRPLAMRLFGSEDAARLLHLFSPTVVFLYVDAIVDGVCKGLGEHTRCVRYNILTSAIDVALLLLLLPKLGIRGYFLSFLISHLLNFCLSLRLLLRLTKHTPDLHFLIRSAFCTVCASAAVLCIPFGLSELQTIVCGAAAFCLVFLLLLRYTEALSPADRLWLRQITLFH